MPLSRTSILIALILVLSAELVSAAESGADLLKVRREYNAISARVDSLVRMMETLDPDALDPALLPSNVLGIPDGTSLVMIFWADDEARIWLNDYLVGETRLTPVEIEIPSLYLRPLNTIRARCWDTDQVESGLLLGLYLKDRTGNLRTVFVSNETWKSPEGPAREITYAHPMPNIPGAKVIWQQNVFGKVEFEGTFDHGAIQKALGKDRSGPSPESIDNKMDYHAFVQKLALLQERRAHLKEQLKSSPKGDYPSYSGAHGNGLSLTLGKAGPLHEDISTPVAEQVKSWVNALPESRKQLLFPERRKLKDEGAANPEGGAGTALNNQSGDRQETYRPPEDRDVSTSGRAGEQAKSTGFETDGEGNASGVNGAGGGFGGGRSSRLGLLLPTFILTGYVGFVIRNWKHLTREA